MMQTYNPYMRNHLSVASYYPNSSALEIPQFVLDAFNRGAKLDENKLHDALFERLGVNPDDVEAAVMIMVSANALVADQLNKLVGALLSSQRVEGRERYAYEKNYIEKNKNGQCVIKSILTKAQKLISENDAKLYSVVKNAREEQSFKYRMADAIDANDGILSIMRKAIERYFVTKLATSKVKPFDIWATVDVLTTFTLSIVARENFQYLTSKNAFPFIATIDAFKFLSGNRFVNQIHKIIENINLLDENGNDLDIDFEKIFYSKELSAIIDDLHRVLLSVEFVKNIFKVRDNLDVKGFDGCKSYVKGWNDSTYSFNYYKSHYAAVYPLDKIKRKKK